MGLWIRAAGEPQAVKPANGERFTEEEVRRYVGGAYEAHRMYERHLMYIRKHGALLGCAFNQFATSCAFWLAPGDHVPGDALIVSNNEKILNYGSN